MSVSYRMKEMNKRIGAAHSIFLVSWRLCGYTVTSKKRVMDELEMRSLN